jgi:3-hydroxyisobutyrate dehydrogenase-like beta-hydroxyacid dehydrogenase
MAKTAFIGLGVMGYPMARHLAKAGHDVTVYNRTFAKAEKWASEHGGRAVRSPEEAARGAEFVFVCVGNDDDVRSVTRAPGGALHGIDRGAVLVDHTTASAALARELEAAAREAGAGFLDAPLSGGQAGAENGALTVMVGGDPATFATAEPVMKAYGKTIQLMGPAGAGQLTKMANQISIAGTVQGLAEALNFAMRAGLDGKKVVDVISQGAAGSWQMANRGHTMVDDKFDFGFAVDWMNKDLDIALAEAKRNGAALPVTALVGQFYREVSRMGGGRWDTSSLIRRLTRIK